MAYFNIFETVLLLFRSIRIARVYFCPPHFLFRFSLRLSLKMSTSSEKEKPYVYQPAEFQSDLQALLESNFTVVRSKEDLERHRDKIVSIIVFLSPPVTEEMMSQFPNLKVIGNCAVGYEHVDLKVCASRGIRVGYTPGTLSDTTADMAWALLLATARKMLEGDKISRSPDTKKFDTSWYGIQVSGTTLGIIGMGRIGLEVARRAAGFKMKVLYYNRNRVAKEVEDSVGANYVTTLTQLLQESDHVVLVAPATKETYRMMGANEFRAMKKTATFVNIARGSLVDHDALTEALKTGTIAAAGLDVTDPEPLPRDHALLTLPNVTISPHTGSATLRTRMDMVQMSIDNVWAVLRGEPMVNEVKTS